VSSHSHHEISRTHTRVGKDIIVPRYIITQPPASSPWLERHRVRLEHAIETVDALLAPREATLQRLNAATILRTARAAKLEDTYHSTTIEGYRVTRDEVRAVIAGRAYQGRTPEEIERLMALTGYAQAFDWVLGKIRDAGERGKRPNLTDTFILDLFLELWRPSVDAGVVDAPALRAWRTQPVQIHGSTHVPPAPEKVGGLITQFVTQLNAADIGPLSRAILAHWNFVNIHPFKDGNGRTARLLMNYLLGIAGLPWTTIRVEERARYFAALEQAHTHGNLVPFATFIADAVERVDMIRDT
jgi:Fic family protein